MEPNREYTRSVAFHEAGHIVIAAVQGVPLVDKGIHLDKWGNGLAQYRDKKPDGSRGVGPEPEREKTIIATCAGWIAQNKIVPIASTGAFHDINQANALLDEMYQNGSPSWWAARESLGKESERLVELHWEAIEDVALALWAKPDTPRLDSADWSTEPREKYLAVGEISRILEQFQIRPKTF